MGWKGGTRRVQPLSLSHLVRSSASLAPKDTPSTGHVALSQQTLPEPSQAGR